MLISVIVPVYQAKKTLKKCIESIRTQSFDDYEIILVDDGSTDGSHDICRWYEKNYNNIKLFHKENGGLMSAWIAGANLSTGDYLCFVDSDDYIDDCMLEMMYCFTSEIGTKHHDSEIICCNHVIEKHNGKKRQVKNAAPCGEYIDENLYENIKLKILGNYHRTITMSRCMKLISRFLVMKNISLCDQSIVMGEDVNIMLPAMMDATRIYIMDDAFYYHYTYAENSMVHKYNPALTENIELLLEVVYNILVEKLPMDEETIKRETAWEMREKEKIFLFMLLIKNELRRSGGDVVSNVQKLYRQFDIGNTLKKYPTRVDSFSDKLLFAIEKNPGTFNINLAKIMYNLKHSN